jgi:hypothetical protein
MNKKQKIILLTGIILITIALVYWLMSGGEIFTKTQVMVEKTDELFGHTYMEWEDKFVLGLDYAGGFSAAIAVVTGLLFFLFRTKNNTQSI